MKPKFKPFEVVTIKKDYFDELKEGDTFTIVDIIPHPSNNNKFAYIVESDAKVLLIPCGLEDFMTTSKKDLVHLELHKR